MVCFHPVKAYYPLECDSDGKRYLKFGRTRLQLGNFSNMCFGSRLKKQLLNNGLDFDYDCDNPYPIYYDIVGVDRGLNITVPCGKCIGCRLDYSRNWALRSSHEAYMNNYYQNNAFLTLTFNDEQLNRRSNPGSLNRAAFTSWIKRLRKAIKVQYNKEIRLMACGEYGSRHSRPHYHMLIYGFNFPDKYVYRYRKVKGIDVIYYRSPFLEEIWRPAYSSESYGFSIIGDVNYESSAYVARYVTKKLFGKYAAKVYKDKEPEFLTSSRMPGLGFDFFKKFYNDFVPRGYIYTPKGFKAPIPRYYINKLAEIDPEKYSVYMMSRFDSMLDNLLVKNLDKSEERLVAQEELKRQNLNMLVREYEFRPNQTFQNEF